MLEFLTPQVPDMHRFCILYLEYASKHYIYVMSNAHYSLK